MTQNKWSKNYFADLAERVGSTFLGALLGLIVTSASTPIDWQTIAWPVLGVPTAVSLIKGLLANMAEPESGASALPTPPGPKERSTGQLGEAYLGLIVGVLLVVILVVVLLRLV